MHQPLSQKVKRLLKCSTGMRECAPCTSTGVSIVVVIMIVVCGGRIRPSSTAGHLPGSSEPDAADRRHSRSAVPRQRSAESQHHLAQGLVARQHSGPASQRPRVGNAGNNRCVAVAPARVRRMLAYTTQLDRVNSVNSRRIDRSVKRTGRKRTTKRLCVIYQNICRSTFLSSRLVTPMEFAAI